MEQGLIDFTPGTGHPDQDKIGLGRDKLQAEARQLPADPALAAPYHLPGPGQESGVLQSGPGRHLGQAVDVKGHPQTVEVIHQFAGAKAVADPKARQAVGLGKGAQSHQGAVSGQIFQAGRHLGVIGKVNIGLVQGHGGSGRHRRQKVFPLLAGKRRCRWDCWGC